jgi:hypothetical protein
LTAGANTSRTNCATLRAGWPAIFSTNAFEKSPQLVEVALRERHALVFQGLRLGEVAHERADGCPLGAELLDDETRRLPSASSSRPVGPC